MAAADARSRLHGARGADQRVGAHPQAPGAMIDRRVTATTRVAVEGVRVHGALGQTAQQTAFDKFARLVCNGRNDP